MTSFLIGITFIPNVNALSDNLRYDFKKNSLDTSDKTNINLRHNNIITCDYNGTYSFVNDSGVPMGWNDLSMGDGVAKIDNYLDDHNAILNITTISTDDAKIENVFYDGITSFGTVELWFFVTDATKILSIILKAGIFEAIIFRTDGDVFKMKDGGDYYTCDIIPLDNVWYHIRIDYESTIGNYMNLNQYETNLYIDGYNEGKFDFSYDTIEIDRLYLNNIGAAGVEIGMLLDAIGYSWSSNYTINENIYPNIEIVDSDILTSDMYQFNFNSTGNPYIRYETNIHGWTNVEPTYSSIDHPEIHYHYYNLDIKNETIKEKNAIWIKSHTSSAGIKNDSLNMYNDKINITFGINFYLSISYLQHSFNVSIKSRNNNEIIKLGFDPVFVSAFHTYDLLDMYYYDGAVWQFLERFHKVKNYELYQFNLYLDNFSVNLNWYKDGVYNNTYTFPFIIERNGVNSISFLNHDSYQDAYFQFIRLCYVGIYQYNISLTKEFGCLRYNFDDTWNFNTYGFFNLTSDDFTKIITYIYQVSYESFNIRNHFAQSIFYNLVNTEVKAYTNLWIITNNTINLNELSLSIEGLKLDKYINNVFDKEITIKYYYHNVNINQSYYYVDNSNRLHYQMSITQNDTWEYMMLYFDFTRQISSNNMSINFKCRELSIGIGKPYIAMTYYQPPDINFYLKTYSTTINTLLTTGKELRRFHFISNDQNNNNYTNFISEGYLYGLQFNYIPMGFIPLPYDFTLFGLLEIIIPLIILIVPTIGIYSVYRKKEIIIPILLLMAIICFSSGLIPFELFFMMLICFGCGIFLQLKYKKEI